MTKQEHDAEEQAKQQLEFYGFWLWNYTTDEFVSFDVEKAEINRFAEIDRMIKCDCCNQRREFCFMCETPDIERQKILESKVFHSGIDISFDDMECGSRMRMSSQDILIDYYDQSTCGKRSSIPNTDFRYKVNNSSGSLEILKVKEEPLGNNYAKLVSRKNAYIKINMSMPLEFILNDFERFYYDTQSKESLYLKNPLIFYEEHYGQRTAYRVMLKTLKTFDHISFSRSAHAARSLGFWLWDTTISQKRFKTVAKAISFLQSGEEFPSNLLDVLGYAASEDAVFNRLRRLTAKCIEQEKVLTIG